MMQDSKSGVLAQIQAKREEASTNAMRKEYRRRRSRYLHELKLAILLVMQPWSQLHRVGSCLFGTMRSFLGCLIKLQASLRELGLLMHVTQSWDASFVWKDCLCLTCGRSIRYQSDIGYPTSSISLAPIDPKQTAPARS